MSQMQKYSWVDVHRCIRKWLSMGVNNVRIWCGPLTVVVNVTTGTKAHVHGEELTYGELLWVQSCIVNRVVGREQRPVIVGSSEWKQGRYLSMRCFYEVLRGSGIINRHWETSINSPCHSQHVAVLLEEEGFLRLRFADEGMYELALHDLRSETYMTVFPDLANYNEMLPIEPTMRSTNSDTTTHGQDQFDTGGHNMDELVIRLPSSMELGPELGFVSD